MLDTVLTEELREEGTVRELLRHIQVLRKEANLIPTDHATLLVYADEPGQAFVEKHKEEILAGAKLDAVHFTEMPGKILSIGKFSFSLSLE